MAETYTVTSTSPATSKVADVVLDENNFNRTILRSEIIQNPKDTGTLSISLLHQKKAKDQKWEDLKGFTFQNVRKGEEVKWILSCKETTMLYEHLTNLYNLDEKRVYLGNNEIVVGKKDEVIITDTNRAHVIKELLHKKFGIEIWNTLKENDPDLATKLSYAQMQTVRIKALNEFSASLGLDKNENYWQDFFNRNQWIFGYGLKYQFLGLVQDQPNYGGTNVTGSGGQKGDFLMHTKAEKKFTVLVEIKKPATQLVTNSVNRSGAFKVSPDLIDGISQLQVNCQTWETEGSIKPQNREIVKADTCEPKGIIVIGDTSQLDCYDKKNTFEQFRKNLHNPEIVTFDELYFRAKYIVNNIPN